MLSHTEVLLALRTRLLTLTATATGNLTPFMYWTTIGDAPAWTIFGTLTRTAAASVVNGYPVDRLVDDDAGNVASTYRTMPITTAGDKCITFLVKRFSVYAAHQVGIFDITTGDWRLKLNIDFTLATPVVTVVGGFGALIGCVAEDTGWRISAKAVGVLSASDNKFWVYPAAAAAADTAIGFEIGDLKAYEADPQLAATATGYTRGAGSFVADGFAPGMEVTAAGFTTAANNGTSVVTAVTAAAIAVDAYTVTPVATPAGYTVAARTLAVEAVGLGRGLTVGVPALRAWENISFDPLAGKPWVEEDYVPGPAASVTVGPLGDVETLPQYVVKFYGRTDCGTSGLSRLAGAALNLFPPHTAMTLASGDVLRVRGDVAPYKGQLVQTAPGYAVVPVTIPLRVRSRNTV